MADVSLLVGGFRYGGWKSISVTRSIETVSGSFSLSVSDRWAEQAAVWPIAEEDPCRVEVAGQIVIGGYVGRRTHTLGASEHTLAISGMDRTAELVECSALLDQWTFRNASVVEIAKKVAEPFAIAVSVQPGLELPAPPRKLAVNPGDTAFEVIARAAAAAGVLVVSDGVGGLLITRAGTGRASPIVEGANMLGGAVEYSAEGRYHRYVVLSQHAGTDQASGGATRIRGEAIDENVRRTERVLVIRPAAGVTAEYARQRADWEARTRAARAETVSVSVVGWLQPDGSLWPINALVPIKSPTLGVDGDMLITQAVYGKSDAGEITQLSLVRPDAFTPEPTARVRSKGKGSAWKAAAGALADTAAGGAVRDTAAAFGRVFGGD